MWSMVQPWRITVVIKIYNKQTKLLYCSSPDPLLQVDINGIMQKNIKHLRIEKKCNNVSGAKQHDREVYEQKAYCIHPTLSTASSLCGEEEGGAGPKSC